MLKVKEPPYISGNLERWSRTNIWTTFWTNIMRRKFNIYNNWTRFLTSKLYSAKYNMLHIPLAGTLKQLTLLKHGMLVQALLLLHLGQKNHGPKHGPT